MGLHHHGRDCASAAVVTPSAHAPIGRQQASDQIQSTVITPPSARRCQGRPGTRASNCGRLSVAVDTPSRGQTNLPLFRRRAAAHPMPSCLAPSCGWLCGWQTGRRGAGVQHRGSHHAGLGRLCASAHVIGSVASHRASMRIMSSSRIQAARCSVAETDQVNARWWRHGAARCGCLGPARSWVRQRHWHERGDWQSNSGMGQAAPLVHDVGIDAVRQSHAGYRSTRPSALGRICCLSSALWRRRVQCVASVMVSTISFGGHHRCRFMSSNSRVGWPRAYFRSRYVPRLRVGSVPSLFLPAASKRVSPMKGPRLMYPGPLFQ